MAVYFLSDVHLSTEVPEITTAFVQTLQALRLLHPDGVFLLGDLFNAWLGDSLVDDFSLNIADEIHALSEVCPVFFQRGNRDFLLGKDFCSRAGMVLIPEVYVLEIEGVCVRVEHGDLLCTDDIGYQRLRKILQHRYFRWFAAHIPRMVALQIAGFLRRQSQQRMASKPSAMVDVNAQAVQAALLEVAVLIHGHTHRPARHEMVEGVRVVLGDWRPEGDVAVLKNGKVQLLSSDFLRNMIVI